MAESAEKHRHHFTPVHYLKNFTDKKGVLHVLSMLKASWWEGSPKSVGFERNLYTLDHPGEGVRPDALEDAFAMFETEVAPVVDRLVATLQMPTNAEDISRLHNFIAFSWARLPSTREVIAAPIRHTRRITMGMVLHSWKSFQSYATWGGYEPTRELYDKLKASEQSGVEPPDITTEEFVEYAMVMMNAMLDTLPHRTWSIMVSERPGSHFVTSDHPLSLAWSDGTPTTLNMSPGHGHTNTDLTVPLSSTVALMGRFKNAFGPVVDVADHNVAATNLRTLMYAGRFVASREKDFIIGGRAGERMRRAADVISDLKTRHKT